MIDIMAGENLKRKHKSSLLPANLKSKSIPEFVESVITLFKKIEKGQQNEVQHSPERIVKSLVRSLGSSNAQVQKNYFSALVAFMTSSETSSYFSVKNIVNLIESELHITKNTQKGEEGEILVGRVLVFGTLVRSGCLSTAEPDDQAMMVTKLLQDIKGKSYLPLMADSFLIEYLKQIDESVFRNTVWPCLRKEVAPGPSQSLLVYHVLLVCEERFPSVVSAKFLKQTLTTPRVLTVSSVPALLSTLKNNAKIKSINHPIFTDVFKYLSYAPGEVLETFWNEAETQLLTDSVAAINNLKPVMAFKFLSLIISNMQEAAQVLNLLTPVVLAWLMKKHKVSTHFQGILQDTCKEVLNTICKLCVKDGSSKTTLAIIKKLLFDPGNVLFEQSSGSRLIHLLMGQMKNKGVMKLAVTLREVITGSSSAVDHKEGKTIPRPWYNKEKLYTVHLFCKLVSLPAVQANVAWKLEQLTFLFDMGFFPTTNAGVELAGLVRESFYSCLNQKLTNLVDLRNILAGIVEHINQRLDNGDQLRIKIPTEVMPAWKKMYEITRQIGENKTEKNEQWVMSVFQPMFYHIGLHLFKEAAFATDFLGELHSVHQRVGKSSSVDEEPHWTEVVVEMFLSLLSRNSQLHRHLIGCIFSHFCPIMIPQNIHQILQILDPTSNTNPLLNSLDPDTESSSEEELSDADVDEDEDKESSDDGMTDEEEDEKVNDKLRRAVVEALGDAGAQTDVESVDLDEMDEEEAVRVDRALSQAFKAMKPAKTKKQSSQAKALLHFRLRVLDLIEVWLGSDPPLDLAVDTLLRLVSLLEHSLVDRHQAPLEARVRTVIKKLTCKKYNTSDCKSLHLGSILKSLIDKGNRTALVYMSVAKQLTDCTLFFVKMTQHVDEEETEDTDNVTVLSVLKDVVKSFFLQRDCLLTAALFERLFVVQAPCIRSIAAKLPSYVFDPNVHPFRRSKALEFIMIFWKNNRVLKDNEEHLGLMKKMSKRLYKGSLKMMEEPVGRTQPKFMVLLKQAFAMICSKNWLSEVNWPQHLQTLKVFQKSHIMKKETKKEKKVNNHTEADSEQITENKMEDSDEAQSDEPEDTEGGGTYEDGVMISSEHEETNSYDEAHGGENDSQEGSDSEEPPIKKSKTKSDSKKNNKKIQQTQLLKNNSKKLRLESMAVGLEENVFSKYSMLANNAAPPSPER